MTTSMPRAVYTAQVDVWVAQLAAARKLKGLTQRDLCHQIGIRQARLSQWETGAEWPNVLSLQLWAGSLGFELQLVPAQSEGEQQ